jgi:hypothetical protein
VDVDGARRGVAARPRALGALQDLEVLGVEDLSDLDGGQVQCDVVLVDRHGARGVGGEVVESDAPDEEGGRGRPRGADLQVGRVLGDVRDVVDPHGGEVIGVEGGDRGGGVDLDALTRGPLDQDLLDGVVGAGGSGTQGLELGEALVEILIGDGGSCVFGELRSVRGLVREQIVVLLDCFIGEEIVVPVDCFIGKEIVVTVGGLFGEEVVRIVLGRGHRSGAERQAAGQQHQPPQAGFRQRVSDSQHHGALSHRAQSGATPDWRRASAPTIGISG